MKSWKKRALLAGIGLMAFGSVQCNAIANETGDKFPIKEAIGFAEVFGDGEKSRRSP